MEFILILEGMFLAGIIYSVIETRANIKKQKLLRTEFEKLFDEFALFASDNQTIWGGLKSDLRSLSKRLDDKDIQEISEINNRMEEVRKNINKLDSAVIKKFAELDSTNKDQIEKISILSKSINSFKEDPNIMQRY